MGKDLKNRLLEWLSESDKNPAKSEDSNAAPKEKKLPNEEQTVSIITVDVHVDELNEDDVPIYETTPGQLRAWHIMGQNFMPLWNYLHCFDRLHYLSFASYGFFQPGYNHAEHFATFALSERRYYRLQFDTTDSYVIDPYEFRILSRLRKISMKLLATVKFEMVVDRRGLDET